jgi:hypothetical protein
MHSFGSDSCWLYRRAVDKELGVTGTHQNSGTGMPCSNEATLHLHLRHH